MYSFISKTYDYAQDLYSVGYSEIVSNCKCICQNSHFYMASLTSSVHLFFFHPSIYNVEQSAYLQGTQ